MFGEGFKKFLRNFFCLDSASTRNKTNSDTESKNYSQPQIERFPVVGSDPWKQQHNEGPTVTEKSQTQSVRSLGRGLDDNKSSTDDNSNRWSYFNESDNGTDMATVGPFGGSLTPSTNTKSQTSRTTPNNSLPRSVPRKSFETSEVYQTPYTSQRNSFSHSRHTPANSMSRKSFRSYNNDDYEQPEIYISHTPKVTPANSLSRRSYRSAYDEVDEAEAESIIEHRVKDAQKKLSQVFETEFWSDEGNRSFSASNDSQSHSRSHSPNSSSLVRPPILVPGGGEFNDGYIIPPAPPNGGSIYSDSLVSEERFNDGSDYSDSESIEYRNPGSVLSDNIGNAPVDDVVPNDIEVQQTLATETTEVKNENLVRESLFSATSSTRDGPNAIFRDTSTLKPTSLPNRQVVLIEPDYENSSYASNSISASSSAPMLPLPKQNNKNNLQRISQLITSSNPRSLESFGFDLFIRKKDHEAKRVSIFSATSSAGESTADNQYEIEIPASSNWRFSHLPVNSPHLPPNSPMVMYAADDNYLQVPSASNSHPEFGHRRSQSEPHYSPNLNRSSLFSATSSIVEPSPPIIKGILTKKNDYQLQFEIFGSGFINKKNGEQEERVKKSVRFELEDDNVSVIIHEGGFPNEISNEVRRNSKVYIGTIAEGLRDSPNMEGFQVYRFVPMIDDPFVDCNSDAGNTEVNGQAEYTVEPVPLGIHANQSLELVVSQKEASNQEVVTTENTTTVGSLNVIATEEKHEVVKVENVTEKETAINEIHYEKVEKVSRHVEHTVEETVQQVVRTEVRHEVVTKKTEYAVESVQIVTSVENSS
ncbi:hypothetical protein HK098_003759 [Nowakowskiella sp. JEL0407]|nr:hypothetical protein HK098_003759 [Nowakowskiella sp. JEL0407]